MEPVPSVKNASDKAQVSRADRRDREQQELIDSAYRAVLETEAGRFLLWHQLTEAGVFQSIWHASALIHYLAGKQDFGHQLMAEMIRAHEDGFELMQREARARARTERNERAATQARRRPEE